MLGGFTVIRSADQLEILQVDVPQNLFLVIARPNTSIKTKDARKILTDQIPIGYVIKQFGNIAGLVIGMQKGDIHLIGRSVEDEIATPIRSKLIPKFSEAKEAAIEAGASGFNISGSGPAMFAVCQGPAIADRVLTVLKDVYREDKKANFYLTKSDLEGTRVIE
jgi:homoserine kinase